MGTGSDTSDQPPDLTDPEATLAAVSAASLRLLAGAVPKPRLEQLRKTVEQSPTEFPWQVVTQAILAEAVDQQRLVQQGLAAQRDWILRGGRTAPGPSIGRRTKGFFARLFAQLIFGALFTIVIVVALLLVQYKTGFSIYSITAWVTDLFAR